jgi:hypothetical protein
MKRRKTLLQKTIDNIIAINTKDTLLQALEQANKPPKLKPLDLE